MPLKTGASRSTIRSVVARESSAGVADRVDRANDDAVLCARFESDDERLKSAALGAQSRPGQVDGLLVRRGEDLVDEIIHRSNVIDGGVPAHFDRRARRGFRGDGAVEDGRVREGVEGRRDGGAVVRDRHEAEEFAVDADDVLGDLEAVGAARDQRIVGHPDDRAVDAIRVRLALGHRCRLVAEEAAGPQALGETDHAHRGVDVRVAIDGPRKPDPELAQGAYLDASRRGIDGLDDEPYPYTVGAALHQRHLGIAATKGEQ